MEKRCRPGYADSVRRALLFPATARKTRAMHARSIRTRLAYDRHETHAVEMESGALDRLGHSVNGMDKGAERVVLEPTHRILSANRS